MLEDTALHGNLTVLFRSLYIQDLDQAHEDLLGITTIHKKATCKEAMERNKY